MVDRVHSPTSLLSRRKQDDRDFGGPTNPRSKRNRCSRLRSVFFHYVRYSKALFFHDFRYTRTLCSCLSMFKSVLFISFDTQARYFSCLSVLKSVSRHDFITQSRYFSCPSILKSVKTQTKNKLDFIAHNIETQQNTR